METKPEKTKGTETYRVLIVEHEPDGDYITHPTLFSLDVPVSKLSVAGKYFLVAGATFPTLYHRGPHSGTVAEWLCGEFARATTIREGYSDVEYDDDDPILDAECAKADYRIEAVTIDVDGITQPNEDVEEFIKEVRKRLSTPETSKDPDSDGSVHPDYDRIGHWTPANVEWSDFCEFWKKGKNEIMDLIFPNRCLRDALEGVPYLVDLQKRFEDDDEKDAVIHTISAPLYHAYFTWDRSGDYKESELKYDRLAKKRYQSTWVHWLKPDLTRFKDMEGEGEGYPPNRKSHWHCDDHESPLFCRDVYSLVNIYYKPSPCPAIGFSGRGLWNVLPKDYHGKASMDIGLYLEVRINGIFGRRPTKSDVTDDDERVVKVDSASLEKLGDLSEWDRLKILLLDT